MKRLWLDLETYSETPIKDGTYRYAEDSEIMLFAYAIDDGPAKVWDLTTGESIPQDLLIAINSNTEVWAQNSMFDRNVLRLNKRKKIEIPIPRWRDTMVKAMMHGLPGGLGILCDIFKISEDKAKIKDGKRLVHFFCKPRPKKQKLRRATRLTHPEDWAKFIEYAKNDIESMRILADKIPSFNWTKKELDLWHLDQKINDRGVLCDMDLAHAAIRAVDRAKEILAERTRELTDDDVESATKRDKLLQHILRYYGVTLPDMKADTLERLLTDPDLPSMLKELLIVRLQSTTTSTRKYNTLAKGVNSDNRLRGLLQFCGAQRTGRWAGRLFQPQNLPRTSLVAIGVWFGISPNQVKDYHIEEYIACGIEALKGNCEDILFDDVMALCANLVRSTLVASPGKKLVVADLANIEGRGAAWLAGEDWKLQAFTDYDAGIGADLYKIAYAKAFGILVEAVGKSQRQIGKVMELMLQYEGGVGAFLTGAATYGIDLEEMATAAWSSIPEDVLKEAKDFLAWKYKKLVTEEQKLNARLGLSERVFVVCDSLKRMWRRAHEAISPVWKELESAAREAVRHKGIKFHCRRITFIRSGNWLRMILPSGHNLCYPSPRVDAKGKISYMGMNQYTRKWERLGTYGGKLLENAIQAISRDVMAYNMADAEEEGFDILLTVHDELITEAPDTPAYSVEALGSILSQNKDWSEGLPLAASGFEAPRYKKD